MPGTRTAPTVDGAPVFLKLSVSWFDSDGDEYTDSVYIDAGSTDAEIEAYIDSLVPASNASLWRVSVGAVYEGAKLLSNAANAVDDSVQDGIVVHYKNPTTRADMRIRIPAPLETMLVAGTEVVDSADALFTGVLAGFAPLVPSGFNPVTARYSQRREINQTTQLG